MRILLSVVLILFLAISGRTQTTNDPVGVDTLKYSVFFNSDADVPDAAERQKLLEFADNLAQYQSFNLDIAAYTDERGERTYNEALAGRRAKSIRQLLGDERAVALSTTLKIYGEDLAAQGTVDDADRKNDRRVDLTILAITWGSSHAIVDKLSENMEEEFIIDATQDGAFTGRKGGHFAYSANSFVDANGNPVNGNIVISLKEAYSVSDMVRLGLVTTSGGRPLQTGGMFRIEAKTNYGEQLTLAKNKRIDVALPTDYRSTGMTIFTGGNAAQPSDWNNTYASIALNRFAQVIYPKVPSDLGAIQDGLRRIFREVIRKASNQQEYLTDDPASIASAQYWYKANPKPALNDYLKDLNPRRVKEPVLADTNQVHYKPRSLDKVLMGKEEINQRSRAKRQAIVKTYTKQKERYARLIKWNADLPEMRKEARARFLADCKVWEELMLATTDQMAQDAGKIKYAILKARYEKGMQKIKVAAERQLRINQQLSTSDGKALDYYFMSINQLGWINCDRFWEAEEVATLLAVVPGGGPKTRVLLIPEETPAILPFNHDRLARSQFGLEKVEKGLSYRIIAYQTVDGKIQYGEYHLPSFNDAQTITLEMKNVSITELNEKVASLAAAK